jgi:CheY-like chemotaxis protein
MHDGKVEIRSDGVNRGSEVFVHLPALLNRPVEERTEADNGNGTPPVNRCLRILVADDFPQSAEILAKLLRQDGNEVHIAQDGIEAIEVAAQVRPHVAVLDLAMPKLNGYQAARVIREQPWGKEVFLIALTGWGHQLDRQRTKEAGFNEHLTKPAKYETLMELLDQLPNDRLESNSHEL